MDYFKEIFSFSYHSMQVPVDRPQDTYTSAYPCNVQWMGCQVSRDSIILVAMVVFSEETDLAIVLNIVKNEIDRVEPRQRWMKSMLRLKS